ncbi:hypothetical protein [Rasiella sp. SM2506]|uniref:hypothetical protein n=1 Tax=Rasiella sp. SM2506 TaxID=3423914 RepID=UPI003D79A9E0
MKKNKLVRVLTLFALSCCLLIFSVMLVHNSNENFENSTAYLVEKRLAPQIMMETQDVNDLDSNLNILIKDKVLVYMCNGCKTDKMVMVPEASVKIADWEKLVLGKDGVPNWIKGIGAIPYAKNVDCKNLPNLYNETMYAANMYRNYSRALKNGATLVMVSKSGSKSFKPGSKEHTLAEKQIYKNMNLSYTTTSEIIERMKKFNCIKSK